MELEALQEMDSEVRALGAQIVALTPELERYARSVHKKLNLTFDILTDLHLTTAEQFRLVFVLPDYLRDLYKSFGSTPVGCNSQATWYRYPRHLATPLTFLFFVGNESRPRHRPQPLRSEERS